MMLKPIEDNRTLRRRWKRYFKRMGRRRYRKLRLAAAALFLAAVIYFGALGSLRERLIRFKETCGLEIIQEKDGALRLGGKSRRGWRIIFRPKNGEIEFCREEESLEEKPLLIK